MPKAINISAQEAAQIPELPENVVMISINDEHYPLYPLQFEERVLRVIFSDITATIINANNSGKDYHIIQPQDSCNILDFINTNLGKHFIVHCAAGISRSSAVCLFLHLIHGYDLKPNFWHVSEPNSVVLRELICHHKKREVGIFWKG